MQKAKTKQTSAEQQKNMKAKQQTNQRRTEVATDERENRKKKISFLCRHQYHTKVQRKNVMSIHRIFRARAPDERKESFWHV